MIVLLLVSSIVACGESTSQSSQNSPTATGNTTSTTTPAPGQTPTSGVNTNATATGNTTSTTTPVPGQTPTSGVDTNATATANAVNQANAQATANTQATANAADADPYPYGGALVYSDPMTDGNNSMWQTNDHCAFTGTAYQVVVSSYYSTCGTIYAVNYSDFVLEVTVRVANSGASCAGIIFRLTSSSHLRLTLCTSLIYQLDDGGNLLAKGTGPDPSNATVIAIAAQGSTIAIYTNGQLLTTVSHVNDGVLNGGLNLLCTGTCSFQKMRIWN